jgi:hypothetical protein
LGLETKTGLLPAHDEITYVRDKKNMVSFFINTF